MRERIASTLAKSIPEKQALNGPENKCFLAGGKAFHRLLFMILSFSRSMYRRKNENFHFLIQIEDTKKCVQRLKNAKKAV
jgi:hypothetical protein